MFFKEALVVAIRSLRSARLRTALTAPGAWWSGVAAVIFLVALGNGMQTGFNQSFRQAQPPRSSSRRPMPRCPARNPARRPDRGGLRRRWRTGPRHRTIASVTPLRNGASPILPGSRTGSSGATSRVRRPHFLPTCATTIHRHRADVHRPGRTRTASGFAVIRARRWSSTCFDGDSQKAVGLHHLHRPGWPMTVIGVDRAGAVTDDQDAVSSWCRSTRPGPCSPGPTGLNGIGGDGAQRAAGARAPPRWTRSPGSWTGSTTSRTPGFRDYVTTALLIQNPGDQPVPDPAETWVTVGGRRDLPC